jgi:filamentous hemagglutinin family protein
VATGSGAAPERAAVLLGSATLAFLAGISANTDVLAAELPVPCAAGTCGSTVPGFVGNGSATATVTGNTLRVDQTSNSALLNWRSFNISQDGTVTFRQPDRSSIALNRIYDANPSRVLGALNSNGRVYLLNQNGIVFGEGAKVNVGGLVASSLNLSQQAIERGIADAVNAGGSAAFEPYTDAAGDVVPSGPVQVLAGASIESPQGQVLLVAPEVVNRGTISVPDGQAILAAGERIYLAVSDDPDLRGLLVEVRGNGSVVNGEDANATREPLAMVGRIAADRGNVTLAGQLVRQSGAVSATTSTRANGSVRLLARTTSGFVSALGMREQTVADIGGTLRLGEGSVTAVTLDATDDSTTVDVNLQPKSFVQLSGRNIEVDQRARITATAGTIDAYATTRPSLPPEQALRFTADESRLVIASDAVLDVSGATVDLPVERNVIRVELRGNQLADSPLQRDGALRSEPVFVDVRRYGTRSDGSPWVGTPLADVSGDVANVRRGVAERNLAGGDIRLRSTGTVLVGRDAVLDVSGGAINWQAGLVNTTRLLGEDGHFYNIADADRDRRYVAVLDRRQATNPRWGVTENTGLADPNSNGVFESAYVEGRDAGSVTIASPQLILDGRIAGQTTVGRYQRLDPASVPTGAFDRIPLGARLTIGLNRGGNAPDLVTPDIVLTPGYVLPGRLTLEDDDLISPESLGSVRIRPELLGADGASRVTLYSNRTVTVPGDVALALPAGGALAVTAGSIAVRGSIDVPSGTIDLDARETAIFRGATPATTSALTVAASSALTARGLWVNDATVLNPSGAVAPLHLNGGTVRLTVSGGLLQLAAGSVIDVSAGAHRRADGTINGGRAGSISIAANTLAVARPADLELGATLRGFALARGGSLSVAANSICISASSCSQPDADLVLAPQWFNDGGFGSITLDARAGDLRVEADTVVELRQRNYEVLPGTELAPTGTSLDDIARVTTLADHLRRPMNLSLRSGYRTQDTLATQSVLQLARGSALIADPLASIALATDGSLLLDGLVKTPGGSITATIDASNRFGYRADQGLWLGDAGVLDVSGVVVYAPNDTGLLTGQVLDGGSIALVARRGFIVAAPGSSMAAEGTIADLDLRNTDGTFTRRSVATRGGRIGLTAAEGMALAGSFDAASGRPGVVEGGALTVRLDSAGRNAVQDFPQGDRQVVLTTGAPPIVVTPGQPLPESALGRAVLSTDAVRAAGFDSLRLVASNQIDIDVVSGDRSVNGFGRIVVEDGVDLHMPARLELAASSVGLAPGATAALLAAPYLELTRDEWANPRAIDPLQLAAPEARSGSGSLRLEGGFVDVLGSVTLDRVGSTVIRSASDVRVSGVLLSGVAPSYVGRLETAGDLTIEASQVYPTTLTRYTIASTATAGTLVFRDVAGEPPAPLSAGGSLTLLASAVDIGTTVRAPFGSITVGADSVQVREGGLLTVSGAGQLVPFGTTQADLAWAYAIGNDLTRIFGPEGEPLPAKRVTLDAADVTIAAGGAIDISGGGDLQGYEFVPGTSGTRDVLSATTRPNQYAILPGVDAPVAQYDPAEWSAYRLAPGTAVWLPEGAGVPAGAYTLLPARYALLPGAYLVTAVDGFSDLPPGQSLPTPLGGRIVAGSFGMAGTTLRDSRTQGFEVRPGTSVQQEARYDLSLASKYFAAIDPRLASTRVPADAGTATLLAATSLSLEGQLRAAVPTGGRGSTLEIAAPELVITDGSEAPLPPGAVAVSAAQLGALGAQTLVIGGTSQSDGAIRQLDVRSGSVRVAAGAQLVAPDIMLVANDLVEVQSGATVSALGRVAGSETALAMPAGAALLRASVAGQVDVIRGSAASAPSGRLVLASGSTVRAPGSITLDVDGTAVTQGVIDPGSGSLGIGAQRVALGSAPADFDGVVVAAEVLQALQGELALRARQELVLFSGADSRLDALSIDAPRLVAGTESGVVRLAADQFVLRGASSGSAVVSSGQATLELSASHLELAGGTTLLSGFERTSVDVSGGIDATGSGTLFSPGSIELAAPLLTTAAGVDFRFESAQLLVLERNPGIPDTIDEIRGLGGRLEFVGASVEGNVNALLPSGVVEFRANGADGDVRLGDQTRLNLGGLAVAFDGVIVATPGGQAIFESANGSISVASGAEIDIRAAGAKGWSGGVAAIAPRGSVSLEGTLSGGSTVSGQGGDITVVARSFDFTDLLRRLGTGGFDGAWDLQHLGPGDLVVTEGETIRARSLGLVAEEGAVRIAGTLDVRALQGGSINVAARGPVEVSGRLDARATGENQRGGRIELASSTGLVLAQGSRLQVAGTALSDPAATAGGIVRLRVTRDALLSVADADPGNDRVSLEGSIEGARRAELEGTARYTLATGDTIGATRVEASAANEWYADAAAFVARLDDFYAGLGVDRAALQIVPGIEVDGPGNLELVADWNLRDWRFGPDSRVGGVLTLRAAGDLVLNGSINDGFATVQENALLDDPSGAWSLRLAGGARTGSVNGLGVRTPLEQAAGGDVVIGAGQPGSLGGQRFVRTGTGDIQVAAARDFILTNAASVLYAAGTAGPGITIPEDPVSGGLLDLPYPIDAGDVMITAGRDVTGGRSTQFFTQWLLRSGGPASPLGSATAWTIDYGAFEQGLASFGGGQVTVRAGRDVNDLSVSLPSIGRQVGSIEAPGSRVQIAGGGNLVVTAGRDVLGGQYFVDGRDGRIVALGTIGHSPTTSLAPLLGIGASGLDLSARRSLQVATAFNPTLLWPTDYFGGSPPPAYFTTYNAASRLGLVSTGGDVGLATAADLLQRLAAQHPLYPWGVENARDAVTIMAPTLTAAAPAGGLTVGRPLSLWPAPRGNLQLLGRGNLDLQPIVMSDAAVGLTLPTPERPGSDASIFTTVFSSTSSDPRARAPAPVHGPTPDDPAGDLEPARIVSLEGDVRGPSGGLSSPFFIPKALRVSAGRDIVGLSLTVQHFSEALVSSVTAGRDFVFPSERDSVGSLRSNLGAIVVDGPGTIEFNVGRDFDLQASRGVVTRGDIRNAALPDSGARIAVTAGLNGREPAYEAFIDRYLVSGSLYDGLLIQYVARISGSTPTDKTRALQEFARLERAQQRPLLQTVLFAELRAGGRSAAQPGEQSGDFGRAFLALETYFPGANPDVDGGEVNAYQGDIRLYFSRLYTLDGGSIDLLAPGGEINVGLATPPVAFGLRKEPSELGIVAQSTGSVAALAYSDFQVNESRTFAADGGDILIWSTRGDIDAGRGAKTAVSAPPPVISIDNNGQVVLVYPAALSGSGIQTLATSPGTEPGDVDLFAPRGVVDAGDAGIVAGNLTIGATAVLGATNIQVSGAAVGVPVDSSGLGASLTGVSSVSGAASSAAEASVQTGSQNAQDSQSIGDEALSWLDVFVVGLGEESCDPKDMECVRRQKQPE